MAFVTITNLRGPAARITEVTSETVASDQPFEVIMTGLDQDRHFHFKGPIGPRGLPGVNAVANDTATAGYLNATDSETFAAAKNVVGQVALSERLDATGGPNLILGSAANRYASAINATSATSIILNPGGRLGQNNIIGGDGSATVGTSSPNVVSAGVIANVSVVGGYDNVAGQLSSKIISDHSYTEISGTGLGHNAIYGGATNIIRGTAQFSGIFAGRESEVSGAYSVAMGYNVEVSGVASRGGGRDHIVSGGAAAVDGIGNTATGLGDRVSGTSNSATADFVNVDGTLNQVSGAHGSAQGQQHRVTGVYSGARGQYGNARDAYQQVFAANPWTGDLVQGKAQTSQFVVKVETTTATATGIGIAGGADGPLVPEGHSFILNADIIAREAATGDTAGFSVHAVCSRAVGGGTAVVGTPTIIARGASAGASTWAVTGLSQNAGKIRINVSGQASKTIRWTGTIRTAEVGS